MGQVSGDRLQVAGHVDDDAAREREFDDMLRVVRHKGGALRARLL